MRQTRIISGLPLSDPTGGFKAIHRDVIEHLDWDQVKSDGYGFQIEVNFFAYKKGFLLKEVPIIFTERRDGQSKFSMSIVVEAALRVLQLGLFERFQTTNKLSSLSSSVERKMPVTRRRPYPESFSKKGSEIDESPPA